MDQFTCQVLKRRRVEVGMSQEHLAERVNTDVRTIRRIENGEVKRSNYLGAICKELNIGFNHTNQAEILSLNKSFTKPNVESGLDLAHLLFRCDNLEYYPKGLESEDIMLIEDFIDHCSNLTFMLELEKVENRRTIINLIDIELRAINGRGLFIYGNSNDLLLNEFKLTELVFVRI